jgi:hypothetical protein
MKRGGGDIMSSLAWMGLLVCLMAMATEAVDLVRNGRAKATIVAPAEGPPGYAAEVLRRNVERMSGAQLPMVVDSRQANGSKVVIRVRKGAAKLDGFHIRTGKDEVIIEASVPRGCVYGAYALLEELGCRFYGPEPLGVVIPPKKNISLSAGLNIVREPAFENRLPSFGGAELSACWGFNFAHYPQEAKGQELLKRMGLKTWRWGHIWPELIEYQFFADGSKAVKMDYADKQEWLPADEKGVRRPNPGWDSPAGQSLCFSQAEAFRWFVENAVNWVLTNCPEADYVNMWSADTADLSLCQCEKCKARGWTPTDWYIHIHNEIWRLLKARGFKGTFGWIVYHGSEEPPQQVKLLDNGTAMDLLYAPRPRGASMHGAITNDHSVNVSYRENLQRWRTYLGDYKGTRTVFEYFFDLVLLGHIPAGRALLIPKPEDMREEMRFYRSQGFNGFFDCDPPSGAFFPDPLRKWLYRKLLWDVNLDIEAAKRDFFRNYYGAAGNIVRAVRDEVEHLMFEEMKWPMWSPAHYADQPIHRLRELEVKLDEALAKVGSDETIKQRIEVMKLWVHYCALAKESEYHVKITRNREKGRGVEMSIRQFFDENQDILVKTGLLGQGDVRFLAEQTVNNNLTVYFGGE